MSEAIAMNPYDIYASEVVLSLLTDQEIYH